MPLYVMIGRDGPDGASKRPDVRPAHLAHIEPLAEAGRVLYGGPLLSEDGNPCGSVVVFEADSLDDARGIAARDPYVTEGVFGTHEVLETRKVVPA